MSEIVAPTFHEQPLVERLIREVETAFGEGPAGDRFPATDVMVLVMALQAERARAEALDDPSDWALLRGTRDALLHALAEPTTLAARVKAIVDTLGHHVGPRDPFLAGWVGDSRRAGS